MALQETREIEHVEDPSIKAFIKLFCTTHDPKPHLLDSLLMTQDVHSALQQVENLHVSDEQSKLHYMTLQDCYNEDKMQCLGLMLSNNLAQ